MELTRQQKQHFIEHGYLKLSGCIPQVLVDRALRSINHSLGEGLPAEDIQRFRARSYCQELQNSPIVTDLINRTPVWAMAESLIGKDQVQPVKSGQIAIRYPRMEDPPDKFGCHLDGMPSEHNGVPKDGTFHNFTMLAVILLSPLDKTNAGNFTVWPGTHRIFEDYFQQHGAKSLLEKGMPPIPYPEPVQIQGEPGDVVFTHYQVAHTAAPNCSPHPRYAAIFRMNHVRRTGPGYGDVMTDIWKEWAGVKELLDTWDTGTLAGKSK